MKMFPDTSVVYLHKAPVDFRKGINGLSFIVEQNMNLNPFSEALFVFCNRTRDKIKVLYWQRNGFCLWQKRLEKDKFAWPRKMPGQTLSLTEEQWHWLLDGLDIEKMKPHQTLNYQSLN
ncbi:IS66 family insertion sequence element accessory protein TnpB [Vibrio splendidus]|uniref:IS66 family insertion sequence element accessory protein TnpB n=1 Tax=Vibrio splendidus TaxID=29497 RepID=A0AA43G317_VIBSP|nr:IS66 family insertion sequence element accessory protein TnpB [Vibrio splendidus]MDH5924562.1 IS66 family insertion sequence element accessory protein TnpB [Vibrio splendidus]